MSLLSSFPEVDVFFSSHQFTDTELLAFLEDIEAKYSDKQLRKALHSLIKLKILQYQVFSSDEYNQKDIITRTKSIEVKQDLPSKYHPLLFHLKNFSIENIALSLGLRTERLINFLAQKGLIKHVEDTFTQEEFKQVQ